jgi:hypothetical protein
MIIDGAAIAKHRVLIHQERLRCHCGTESFCQVTADITDAGERKLNLFAVAFYALIRFVAVGKDREQTHAAIGIGFVQSSQPHGVAFGERAFGRHEYQHGRAFLFRVAEINRFALNADKGERTDHVTGMHRERSGTLFQQIVSIANAGTGLFSLRHHVTCQEKETNECDSGLRHHWDSGVKKSKKAWVDRRYGLDIERSTLY